MFGGLPPLMAVPTSSPGGVLRVEAPKNLSVVCGMLLERT
jgi:hypothetical protein